MILTRGVIAEYDISITMDRGEGVQEYTGSLYYDHESRYDVVLHSPTHNRYHKLGHVDTLVEACNLFESFCAMQATGRVVLEEKTSA